MNAMQFSHVGVAVPAIDDAVECYRRMFGFEILSGPFCDPVQDVAVCFVGPQSGSDWVLELVEPCGPGSPVSRTLSKGIGAYHICFETEDIEAALVHLHSEGCVVLGRPAAAAAFGGCPIGWVWTPAKHLVELVERPSGSHSVGWDAA